MPDQFGNPTPQEVVRAIQQKRRMQYLQGQQSSSPGVQLGTSLAAIFGGSIKKTFDTAHMRKVERERLMRTQAGMTEEEAREIAKTKIPRQFREVRQAHQIQEAQADMQQIIDDMPAEIPRDQRTAQAKLILSSRLRNMGMTTQANQLAAQANAEMLAAQDAALTRANLQARTRQSVATEEEIRQRLPYAGLDGFQKLLAQRESLTYELEDPNTQLTPVQRDAKLYMKGKLEAKILKDSTIVGRTEEDVRSDPVLMRSLFGELKENNALIAQLDAASTMLNDLDSFEVTFMAGLKKDFLGFMQETWGRMPKEGEQEYIQRIVEKEAKPTLIAAMIRHALTGAQMSAFEIQYLTPFLPSPDDPVAVTIAKLKTMRDYTQLETDVRMAMFQMDQTDRWFNTYQPGSLDNPLDPGARTVGSEMEAAAEDLDSLMQSTLPPSGANN